MDIIINIYIYYICTVCVSLYQVISIYIYIHFIRFPAPLAPSRASSYDFADANSESYSPRAAFAAPQGRFPDSARTAILSSHSIHGDPGSALQQRRHGTVAGHFLIPWNCERKESLA